MCKGLMESGQTTVTVDFGAGVVVFRHVPAQICQLYGADWIDDRTAALLENFVNTARQRHLMVEVTPWQAGQQTLG